MAALTFYRPNGEWGIEGVDLTTLPPKVYGALCKLHDLEYHEDVAIEHLARMCGVPTKALTDFIEFAKQASPLVVCGGPTSELTPGSGDRGGHPIAYRPEIGACEEVP